MSRSPLSIRTLLLLPVPGTAPAGTVLAFSGMDIMGARGGKFVEYWVCTDGVHFMLQLGVLPSS